MTRGKSPGFPRPETHFTLVVTLLLVYARLIACSLDGSPASAVAFCKEVPHVHSAVRLHELVTHRTATRQPISKKEPITIRSHTLTPSTAALLKQMRQAATDYIGGGVSSSAVVRALILYAGQQPPTWMREILFPLIAEERSAGRLRGKMKSE